MSNLESFQLFGFDKNMIFIFVCIIIILLFLYYLFNMVKKLREDIRVMKSREIENESLLERIEYNNEAVKAIELKIDQLNSCPIQPPRVEQVDQESIKEKLVKEEVEEQEEYLNSVQNIKIPVMGREIKL